MLLENRIQSEHKANSAFCDVENRDTKLISHIKRRTEKHI